MTIGRTGVPTRIRYTASAKTASARNATPFPAAYYRSISGSKTSSQLIFKSELH